MEGHETEKDRGVAGGAEADDLVKENDEGHWFLGKLMLEVQDKFGHRLAEWIFQVLAERVGVGIVSSSTAPCVCALFYTVHISIN